MSVRFRLRFAPLAAVAAVCLASAVAVVPVSAAPAPFDDGGITFTPTGETPADCGDGAQGVGQVAATGYTSDLPADATLPASVSDTAGDGATYCVTSIGSGAFRGSALTSVRFLSPSLEIGDEAFQDVTSLASVDFSAVTTDLTFGRYAFAAAGLSGTTVLPASTSSIQWQAFRDLPETAILAFAGALPDLPWGGLNLFPGRAYFPQEHEDEYRGNKDIQRLCHDPSASRCRAFPDGVVRSVTGTAGNPVVTIDAAARTIDVGVTQATDLGNLALDVEHTGSSLSPDTGAITDWQAPVTLSVASHVDPDNPAEWTMTVHHRSTSVVRHHGPSRTETACAAANAAPKSDTTNLAYVASSRSEADAAVAAAAVAGKNTVALLTEPDMLPGCVADYLNSSVLGGVVVVGGEGAVSETVKRELDDIAWRNGENGVWWTGSSDLRPYVERKSGDDRYVTSAANASGSRSLVFALGTSAPDMAAAASLSQEKRAPLVLVRPGAVDLSPEIAKLFEWRTVDETWIVGGTGVVSAEFEEALRQKAPTSRVFGDDRYQTSLAAAAEWEGVTSLALANGVNPIDAFGAVASMARLDAPVVLTPPTCVTPGVADYIAQHAPDPVRLLGGTGVISPAVETLTRCP